jgi:hypothetical protein
LLQGHAGRRPGVTWQSEAHRAAGQSDPDLDYLRNSPSCDVNFSLFVSIVKWLSPLKVFSSLL